MYLSDRPRRDLDEATEAASGAHQGRVARTVVLLGFVSLLTDLSSESTAAVLPLYLTVGLGLSPLAYGLVDGIYQGASILARFLGGWVSDRLDRPKPVAVVGYGLSAVARLGLLALQSLGGITAVLTADRIGKGLRTAPRDALIAAASDSPGLGRAYGVHRALDTTGAVLGPLVAFVVLLALPGDYSSVFVVSCAAALVGLAVLVLLVPDLRPAQGAADGVQVSRPSLRLLTARPVPTARRQPPACWGCSRSATDSSTSSCRTVTTSRPAGSRCCSSAPTWPTSPSRCPWAAWRTGSVGLACW